jgi:malonyl-ACP O-methyltransferase BioC
MRLNKERIRLRFARAATTYDNQAVVQLKVAERLVQLLRDLTPPPSRILEIGCCTGLLTKRVLNLFPDMTTFYVNDLVPDFAPLVNTRLNSDPRVQYLAGDIEHIEIPENLDLVVSSSTLHWLDNLPVVLKKLYQCLVPGGSLCFSLYGTENLREVRQITGVGLDYYSIDELQNIVSEHFDILTCSEETVTLHFSDPLTLLNHLRETGVNALNETPWTRSRLDTFLREYSNLFGNGEKVVVTYHPLYCKAKKSC